jgi:hypothetical protein
MVENRLSRCLRTKNARDTDMAIRFIVPLVGAVIIGGNAAKGCHEPEFRSL